MAVGEWYFGTIQGNTSGRFFTGTYPASRYVDIQARPIVGRFPSGQPLLRVTDLSIQINNDGSLTYFWNLHNDSGSAVNFVFRMLYEDY